MMNKKFIWNAKKKKKKKKKKMTQKYPKETSFHIKKNSGFFKLKKKKINK